MKVNFIPALAIGICCLSFLSCEKNLPTDEATGSGRVAAAGGGGTSTGQGIMVKLLASGDYSVSGSKVYKFDETAAATYFTTTISPGVPTNCNGSPTNCNISNTPAAPLAPAPNVNKLKALISDNKCRFLSGATLSGTTYTQTETAAGLNGRGNFEFTFTYTIAPTTSDPVAPYTAWPLFQDNTDGTATIPVSATIAGESAMSSKQFPKKYSFSLDEGVDINGDPISRVQDLVLTVDGVPTSVSSHLVFGQNFMYVTNAGSNGTTSLLVDGDATSILNNDSQPGNNNGGVGGKDLASALVDAIPYSLGEGAHTINLTGKIKGNSATADIGFSVTSSINIVTPGCNGQNQ
ncbi:hypothetical protein [Spirosoma aerophilum]